MNPFQSAPNSKKLMTVIGVYIALITSFVVSSSNSILLPVAAKEIGGLDYYPLATSLAGSLAISLMPLYGFIAATSPSSKRMLSVFSFIVPGVIIIARGFANDMWAIIIPSFFLTFYTPAIYVLGYSTIRDMYDAKRAGLTLGFAGTMQAIGILSGAPLVGLLADLAGWRLPFFVIGTLFFVAAILVFFGVKVTKDEVKHMVSTKASFDFLGAAALVVFLTTFILALSLGKLAPFGSPVNNILLIVTAALLIVLIVVITKKKSMAIIPSTVLSDRNTLCLASFNMFLFFSTMALYIFMPMYAMYAMKQSMMLAGLTLTCMAVVEVFIGPIYGRMIGKAANARTVALLSAAIRVVVQIAFIILLTPTTSIYLVYALMLILGFSNAANGAVPAVGPQVQIANEKRQLGNSVVQLGMGFGGAISIAVYTMVIGAQGVENGMITSLYISTAAAVFAFLTSLLLKKLPVPVDSEAKQ